MAKRRPRKNSAPARKPRGKSAPQSRRDGRGADGPLDELKRLYEFMTHNGLQALELDRKDFHVRLVRRARVSVPVPVPVPAVPAAPAPGLAAVGAATASAAPTPSLPAGALVIKSPMMGVFYRASSPSSPPFVKEGAAVEPGDLIGLIEAMKVFNDVKAEVAGTVTRILIENGKAVKAGQDMFWIEPSR
ncbi:MAG: acetyl-CoA carboxylase biotin carboxyl carrier protein [Elusimicrobiota bacterium]